MFQRPPGAGQAGRPGGGGGGGGSGGEDSPEKQDKQGNRVSADVSATAWCRVSRENEDLPNSLELV